jgi:histidinol phosphatase-like PHP family hydrolase
VAKLAREFKAPLVLNTDSHAPRDLIGLEMARRIAAGAGLKPGEIKEMFQNSEKLVRKIL